jgi:hypothetical protein
LNRSGSLSACKIFMTIGRLQHTIWCQLHYSIAVHILLSRTFFSEFDEISTRIRMQHWCKYAKIANPFKLCKSNIICTKIMTCIASSKYSYPAPLFFPSAKKKHAKVSLGTRLEWALCLVVYTCKYKRHPWHWSVTLRDNGIKKVNCEVESMPYVHMIKGTHWATTTKLTIQINLSIIQIETTYLIY